jgi:hypothetical protein
MKETYCKGYFTNVTWDHCVFWDIVEQNQVKAGYEYDIKYFGSARKKIVEDF